MMLIEKEKLIKKAEELSNKFSKSVPILSTDLNDIVLFLSIYGGSAPVLIEELSLKFSGTESPKLVNNFNKDGTAKKVNRGGEPAMKYISKSYDGSITLETIFSKQYLKIERIYDGNSNYYISEYFFKSDGSFIRKAKQKSCPLGKQLDFSETSEGNLKRGVCFAEITEKTQNLDVKFIKVLTTKGEEIYYSYTASPEFTFAFRLPKTITLIPSITSLGMKALSQILEMQFEKKFLRLDEKLFDELAKSAKEIFEQQKKSAN